MKKVITFESVAIDVNKGCRKSIKCSFHDQGKDNLKDICIAD